MKNDLRKLSYENSRDGRIKTMKKFKALHINSIERTVTEVTIEDSDSLKQLQNLVGGFIEPAGSFENGDYVFVDEEGLYKYKTFFEVKGFHQPFAGNGEVIGTTNDGDNASAETTLEELKRLVTFSTLAEIRERF